MHPPLTRVLVPLVLSRHTKVQQQFVPQSLSQVGLLQATNITRGRLFKTVVFQLRIELYDTSDKSRMIKTFPTNQHARQPVTTFQATSIDRLHWHLGFPFGDHDSQVTVTLGSGAAQIFCHSVLSRSQAFVHHEPRNLQPEPFRQFFDAHGEPLKLKACDFHD